MSSKKRTERPTVKELQATKLVSPRHAYNLFHGVKKPGVELAFAIQDATGYPARAWCSEPAKSEAA